MENITKTFRIEKEVVENFTDFETGEIKQRVTSKEFSTKTSVDRFYMVFLGAVTDDLTGKEIKLLSEFCMRAEWNKGYLDMSTFVKNEIIEATGLTSSYYNNLTSSLEKKKYISKDKGRYFINPKFFWRGELKYRKQMLQKDINLRIKFEIDD
jgi:hypothetical protein